MRTKKAILNSTAALLLQMAAVVCGLIVPRIIIGQYGSAVNGMIVSITKFLAYIELLEMGVGGMTRAVLYKPLADKDTYAISAIMKATEAFYRKIIIFFIPYTVIIAICFPYLSGSEFNWIYTASMVFILSISTIMQFGVGISNALLVQADQRMYVYNGSQIALVIGNAVITVLLVKIGMNVHVVKLFSSLIFSMRPLMLRLYVKNHYQLTRKCEPDPSAIKQKWNASIHQISFFLHSNTATVLLTLFAGLKEVSVYSVYTMVVTGIEKMILALVSGVSDGIGNMLAKKEDKAVIRVIQLYDFVVSSVTVALFSVAGIMIIPFISIYTKSVSDTNYIRPAFAVILILAEAVYCVRQPYYQTAFAAGHYKETRSFSVIEVVINVAVSLILVNILGLVGVAIGALASMIIRMIQNAYYLSRHIVCYPFRYFLRRQCISILTCVVILLASRIIPLQNITSYLDWVICAAQAAAVSMTVTLLSALIFDRDKLTALYARLKK